MCSHRHAAIGHSYRRKEEICHIAFPHVDAIVLVGEGAWMYYATAALETTAIATATATKGLPARLSLDGAHSYRITGGHLLVCHSFSGFNRGRRIDGKRLFRWLVCSRAKTNCFYPRSKNPELSPEDQRAQANQLW